VPSRNKLIRMAGPSPLPPGIVSLDDYEAIARTRLGAAAWAYFAGGAADERTIAWNREAFDRLRLRGRVLADMSRATTRVTLLGEALDYPILLAPVALQRLAHPDGECETARAASAMRALMVVSTEASVPIEDIARASQAPLWFQLYVQHDRGFTEDLVRRAEAAGYRALVLTVDAPVTGARHRLQRMGASLPPGIDAVNLRGARQPDVQPASLVDSALFGGFLSTAATWKDVEWLLARTRLPVVLKGISSDIDAEEAVKVGAKAIAVSNHGGRTLDTLPAAIDMLPPIADRVAGSVPLVVDGGIRRGTDVLKALALGATAVMIGRPYVYGLAVAGGTGVAHVLGLLRTELEIAMTLTGCASPDAITPAVIWPRGRELEVRN
jgi:4-hydroxymandelate oxidase